MPTIDPVGCGTRQVAAQFRRGDQADVNVRRDATRCTGSEWLPALLSRKQERPAMSSLTAAVDLPPTSESVPVARHMTVELLRVWQAPHDPDDVALLVTELVTNVVDHVDGEAMLTLELALAADSLKIAVADGSSVRPVVRELNTDNPRGRGLQLVQAIADGWGIEEHHGGKRVWLTLQHPPSAS
jgi:hypothetical protein